MSDDEDVVSSDGGMEPEVSIEDIRAGRAGGGELDGDRGRDGDDDVSEVESTGLVTKRGAHVISDRTRDLFKKASESVRAQLIADGDEGVTGEYDEGVAPREVQPAARSERPATDEVPADKLSGGPPVTASTDQPSAEAQAYRAQLEARAADLEAREKALATSEGAADLGKARTQYLEHGAVAVRDLIKGWLGKDATDDDLRQEVADLITDLSVQVLGVDVPSEIRAKMDTKRALRSVKVLKESITESEAVKAKRAEADREEQGKRMAINALNQEIKQTAKEYAKKFPYLAAEDDPGELVYLTAQKQHAKDGTILQWEEAARRVDEHLKKQVSAFFDKRKHLIAAPAQAGGPDASKVERVQGDPQGIRRSHTLTAAATGTTSAPSTPRGDSPPSGKWSREAHRANTRSKFRDAFKSAGDD